jgi:hypothetical protein
LNQYRLAVEAGLAAVKIVFFVFGRKESTLAAPDLRDVRPSGNEALSSQPDDSNLAIEEAALSG